ncbi:hypothetical protein MMC34_004823 [Xylographa carneopallida]|nr:hypothetical protein [Xylographa carneopallida]
MAASSDPFYVPRVTLGDLDMKFDFRALGDGRSASARYANHSNYRNDSLIRKEMCVSSLLIAEIKRIIKDSEIMKEDDSKWPEKNRDGRQELEIRLGTEHISFETAKIGSLVDVTESADPEGLRVFYYLVQDLKALVFSLISLHFKPHKSMPTPRDDTCQLSAALEHERSSHTTCPPDNGRIEEWRALEGTPGGQDASTSQSAQPQPQPESSLEVSEIIGQPENHIDQDAHMKMDDTDQDLSAVEGQSPASTATEAGDVESGSSPSSSQRPSHTSSFLRAGSKFQGTQQSDKQIYKVEVDIKHVDMNESFLCGYLRIEGLTEEHATLTTYFEGEIIGPKYTFQTKHDSWGATDKTDMQHWARFPAWRPLAKQAKRPDFHYKNCAQRENIFMRWKEYFLVPDHRVREITGASFEGFYYICFNQVAGKVSGIYFHAKSEKLVPIPSGDSSGLFTSVNRYQRLELSHVDDKGCLAAIEFR